jgi:crossover junction endodeoxyribonuclease RuvC
MIAIGIDPGTATTGYGVVSVENNFFKCLDYGIIDTDKNLSDSVRLDILNKKLKKIIKNSSPDIFAIESIYFFKNAKTVISVSQARGVALLTAEKKKLPIYEFTPLEVKMNIANYGRADKKQIQEMVKRLLNLKEIPRPDDAADALGIAICGLIKHNIPYEKNNY